MEQAQKARPVTSNSVFGLGSMDKAFGDNTYGFSQSEKTYSIPEYMLRATKFKNDYEI